METATNIKIPPKKERPAKIKSEGTIRYRTFHVIVPFLYAQEGKINFGKAATIGTITAISEKIDEDTYHTAYAFCGPEDLYNDKYAKQVGRRLAKMRLQNHPCGFKVSENPEYSVTEMIKIVAIEAGVNIKWMAGVNYLNLK